MTKENNGWISVEGYEDCYEINAIGQIRSIERVIYKSNGTMQRLKSKILKTHLNSSGYPVLRLSNLTNGKREMVRLHRLLAKHFIPNPENKPEVNHIDGDKQNFSLSNLEWVTPRENRKHAWDSGLRTREHLPVHYGENKYNSKLTNNKVIEMRKLRDSGVSYSKIAKLFSIHKTTAMNAIKGITWKCVPPPPTK